jgi:hypothetical protein
MRVRPESVTHLVVKLFNVKSKFDYIDKNKQKSEIANNDKFTRIDFPEITIIFWIFGNIFFLTRRLFKGSVGERGNKLYFNLGLGCQSSN